ncbi:MAG: DUF3881 family protein [Lachnospiraceae bacterium]|nr:DUF3881 family protein [Lachnospiraceae bacterium]
MHSYLRAVGFSDIKSKKELKKLLNLIVTDPDNREYVEVEDNLALVEYYKCFTPTTGVCLRGEYDKEEELTLDFYYPICIGDKVSTEEDVNIERHAAELSYAGVCEDSRVGVTLIFYMQNGLELVRRNTDQDFPFSGTTVTFAALSTQGIIMLPIKKDEKEKEMIKKAVEDRNEKINAARMGDEEAIESLTLEDIDTYNVISRQILKEDVFSLVDTYLMPYGVECDQYSILAEIEDVTLEVNSITGEEIYILDINYNSMPMKICINKKDLLGEPLAGRRFRGVILLQGHVNFDSDSQGE